MIRGNAKLRRRGRWSVAVLLVFLVVLVGTAVCVRVGAFRPEVKQAKAIIAELQKESGRLTAPNRTASLDRPVPPRRAPELPKATPLSLVCRMRPVENDSFRMYRGNLTGRGRKRPLRDYRDANDQPSASPQLFDLGDVPEDHRQTEDWDRPFEVPLKAWRLLRSMRASAPWFDDRALAETTRDLDHEKEQGSLTQADEALDPRAHTADEIRATVCAVLRRSESLNALREAAKTSEPDWRGEWPRSGDWEAALDTMLPCLVCESSGRNPQQGGQAYLDGCNDAESATKAYLDAYRMNVLAGCNGYETAGLDNSLASVFDAYPGPIPETIARDILALVDWPHDLTAKKNAHRLSTARTVERYPKERASELQRRMSVFLVEPVDTIRFLLEPNETAGLISATDRALALVEKPPYQVHDAFAIISETFPHAQDQVAKIRALCSDYHRHLTMAAIAHTVIALKQYKSEHGRYPETLDGLTPSPIPALPVNPENGQPLRYTVDGEGFTIAQAEKVDESFPIAWKAFR